MNETDKFYYENSNRGRRVINYYDVTLKVDIGGYKAGTKVKEIIINKIDGIIKIDGEKVDVC